MPSSSSNTKQVNEAASFLLFFSFFALIEGIIRMTSNSRPSLEVDYFDTAGGTQIPVFVLLLGGVAEVLFGISGVFVAFFQLFFEKGSPTATLVFAIMQSVLGWFVFLVYVVSAPIIAARNTEGIPDVLSQSESRSLIILGNLVGSITFCWALQGGQYIMALRLMAAQKGEVVSKAKNTLRAYVWSGNLIVAALSTLYVGILLKANGFNSNTAPIGAPPHVVWFPVISVMTGLVMLTYGIISVVAVTNIYIAANVMPFMWAMTTVYMMVNFSWVFGIVPGLAPPIPGAAQHAGLILSVTILPVFHVWRLHYPEEEEGEEGVVEPEVQMKQREVATVVEPSTLLEQSALSVLEEQSVSVEQSMA